ncbi:ABC-type transport system [Dissulfuribacter thermophilus]|uniref:ABC-type transport system n=1 Tax=Dissulfuribacter thermophilus TaxID=1156395 RepID=A0A1B9F5R9_9BACT|nr:ABC transporter substrate-binding protein [Dissulfuribacter thermophilus]OCC15111.1 ABC-type transport system [Dissulfuribacter thermophilus]
MKRNSVILPIILLTVALNFGIAFANNSFKGPQQVVQTAIDSVIETLKKYPCINKADANCKKQKDRIHEIAGKFIDFDQVGKLALGRFRRHFSKEEWQEFKILFRELLENTYMKRLQEYSGEKIVFESVRRLSEVKAQVDTKVISSTKSIPVSYRLVKRDGCWKVYDILVEGVSLLKNYRQQFTSILRSKKPAYLNKLLERKVASLEKGDGGE